VYTIVYQILDICIATQEPQQLVDYTLHKDTLRGEQREAIGEVEAHLIAKDTLRARTRSVITHNALVADLI
jgi:hypothetical protein